MGDESRSFIMDIFRSEVLLDMCAHYGSKRLEIAMGIPVWSPEFKESASRDLPACSSSATESASEIGGSRRPKRQAARSKTSAESLFSELRSGEIEPHQLVEPYRYGDPAGVEPEQQQPFRVVVHPQVMFLTDVHSQLSTAEVIGMLAGKYDEVNRTLYVQCAFPCAAVERSDNGATDVELDPEAQIVAKTAIEELGLITVGWYHSHPKFLPDPSIIDLGNQYSYQTYFPHPFIGLIVSTCEKNNPSLLSQHRWFVVKRYNGRLASADVDIPLPLWVDVQTPSLDLSPLPGSAAPSSTRTTRSAKPLAALAAKTTTLTAMRTPHPAPKSLPQRTGPLAAARSHGPIPSPEATNSKHERSPIVEQDASLRAAEPCQAVIPGKISSRKASGELGTTLCAIRNAKSDDDHEMSESTKKRARESKPSKSKPHPHEPANGHVSSDPHRSDANSTTPETSAKRTRADGKSSKAVHLPNPIFSSLVAAVQHSTLQSSRCARELICSCWPQLLSLSVNLVSLGFYYSRYAHRVELASPWRGQERLAKVQLNAQRWLQLYESSHQPQRLAKFVDLLVQFLRCCWEDFTKAGKLRHALPSES